MEPPYRVKLTDNGTTVAASGTRFVKQVVIACTTAGQTVKITDHGGGLTLIPVFSPAVPTTGHAFIEQYDPPVPMNGIDIVTTATGVCSFFISFGENA